MQYLITGGAGFLGVALANRLVAEGHAVRVLDDLRAGDPTRLSHDVSFTRGDVNDIPKLWTRVQGVQCVYHLPASVSVPPMALYPRDSIPVTAGGTIRSAESIRAPAVTRVQ